MKLQELGKAKHKEYINNPPFAHMGFKDLFDTDTLRKVHDEFPVMEADMSRKTNPTTIKKYGYRASNCNILKSCQPHTRNFLKYLNGDEFLSFLEDLTGIDNLLADDTFEGAGPCSIGTGGLLKMHIDFNSHPSKRNLHRRVNVLVYLNENWEEEWGGHLDLWDDVEKGSLKVRIPPHMNTTAIFSTTEKSWHGHPDPLRCPEDRLRRFISAYYYTEGFNIKAPKHSTIYKKRPNLDAF